MGAKFGATIIWTFYVARASAKLLPRWQGELVKNLAPVAGVTEPRFCRRQLLAHAASWTLLHPLISRATVPFDMARYGDRELQVATLNRLKQAVRDAASAEPELIPAFFELAVADALDFRRSSSAGGLDGSVRFLASSSPSLTKAVAAVDKLQRALVAQTEVTYADMLAYSGGQAIEIVGGPRVLVQLGRDDASSAGGSGGGAGTPLLDLGAGNLQDVRAVFSAAGLGSRELVLLAGTLGVLRDVARNAKPAKEETFSADEDDETTSKLAGYAEPEKGKGALGIDVRMRKLDSVGGAPFGSAYLALLAKSDAGGSDPIGAMLLSDPELRAIVGKYASEKPAQFGKDAAELYQTITTLGKVTSTRNS